MNITTFTFPNGETISLKHLLVVSETLVDDLEWPYVELTFQGKKEIIKFDLCEITEKNSELPTPKRKKLARKVHNTLIKTWKGVK